MRNVVTKSMTKADREGQVFIGVVIGGKQVKMCVSNQVTLNKWVGLVAESKTHLSTKYELLM